MLEKINPIERLNQKRVSDILKEINLIEAEKKALEVRACRLIEKANKLPRGKVKTLLLSYIGKRLSL